jgi:O-antigen ligase
MSFRPPASPQFWVLSAFLVFVFLTGGASRIDVQSLIILRPVSTIACALALLTLRRDHLKRYKAVMTGFAAVLLVCVLHLVPLPPALWQALPGREIIEEVDLAAGFGSTWRPLSMTPLNGWHSLLSLLTPLAVLLFGVQLNRTDLFRLLAVMLGIGALSGLIGILQVIGSPTGTLYFYRITNNGSAVGLFSNRNHNALFLASLFPMLAVFASAASTTESRRRFRQVVSLGAIIVNVPLILVTGSRSGLIVGFIGLLAAVVLYRKPEKGRTSRKGGRRWRIGPAPFFAGIAVLCTGLLTVLFSRAEAFTRLFAQSTAEDNRTEFWTVSIDLIGKYFPWGSGLGSFVEAYQIAEPAGALNPLYVNHAHNDWIEILMTLGLPGAILLLAGLGIVAWQTLDLWRRADETRPEANYGKMAGVVIGMMAIASAPDYPLRTPSLLSLLVCCLLWLFAAGRKVDAYYASSPASRDVA